MDLGETMRSCLSRWVKESGPEQDIVLSSRARLGRNVTCVPFPQAASDDQLRGVVRQVGDALTDIGLQSLGLAMVDLAEVSPLERQILVEKHLVSPDFVREPRNRAVVTNSDETVSIMVNEEDHLRIQAILPGFQLESALAAANQIDDALEAHLHYAFHDTIGYLTSCPTNVGTGLRASVMVHLPALATTGQLAGVLHGAGHLGLAVRGLFGEGSSAVGDVYQVSNQVTLGRREDEILASLGGVVAQIVDHERAARKALLDSSRVRLEDRVRRAYGILREARVLPTAEAAELLSQMRLGIETGLISEAEQGVFSELLVVIQPAFLQRVMGRDMDVEERDAARATLVRERLKQG